MRLEQELKTAQVLDKKQFLSLKMLSLNSVELAEFLDSEILSNPLIEFEDMPGYYASGAEEAGKAYEMYAAQPEEDLIFRELLEQIDLNEVSRGTVKHIVSLIHLMDEEGYIRYTLKELSGLMDADEKDIKKALDMIKNMKPAGVGAYDLAECLLLQMRMHTQDDKILEALICHHLQDLAEKNDKRICRELNIGRKQLDEYRKIIGAMNPRPLAYLTRPEKEAYIVPDIIYSRDQAGKWRISLSEGITRRLHVSREYENFNFEYADSETRKYYYSNLNRIKLINHGLDKREHTLRRLAEYFLKIQIHYFETGAGLKPLSLKDTAEALSMHESTISRAVKERYVQLPDRVIPMKTFLARRPKNNASSQMPFSASHIKEMICAMVAEEDPERPLSDTELCRMLQKSGAAVSRRTVAKYRCQKNIENSFERKRGKNEH